GTRALERTLVGDVAAAVRLPVVDEEAVLQVLTGPGEEDTEQLGVTSGTVVCHRRIDPDGVSAQSCVDGPQGRVPADRKPLAGNVDRSGITVLDGHQRQSRVVAQP